MKILLTLLLLSPLLTHAQTARRHQVSLSVGAVTPPADKDFDDFTLEMCRRYDWNPANRYQHLLRGRRHRVATLSYHYRATERLSVGASVTLGSALHHYRDEAYYPGSIALLPVVHEMYAKAHMTSRMLYVAPSVRYVWFAHHSGWTRLYSGASVGAYRLHTRFRPIQVEEGKQAQDYDETRWRMGYQVTALGVDYGKGLVSTFAEVGYGHQGLLTVGLRMAW